MIRPRVGFLGTGWIGRHRMEAMLAAGTIEAVAVADASQDAVAEALKLAPDAQVASSLDAMLALGLDGVVIATPSALHADQTIRAIEAGAAVFCQKPLGRNAQEVADILSTARRVDRLLAVDFSYRHTAAMQHIKPLLDDGALGSIRAVDLVFHNAYGPDKAWFYDAALSGGGCLMDLGVHLVDLALWSLGFPEVVSVDAALFAGDRPLRRDEGEVEDLCLATLRLAGGTIVRLACSWRLHAGRDAVIEATFHGTEGGAALRNVAGSFYDFEAERYTGTARETLTSPPDAWGGRAGVAWAERLALARAFDPEADRLLDVADAMDRIYAAGHAHDR